MIFLFLIFLSVAIAWLLQIPAEPVLAVLVVAGIGYLIYWNKKNGL